jgi:hypothetical protein
MRTRGLEAHLCFRYGIYEFEDDIEEPLDHPWKVKNDCLKFD